MLALPEWTVPLLATLVRRVRNFLMFGATSWRASRRLKGPHPCDAPDTDDEWTCPVCGQAWRAGEPVPVWLREDFQKERR
jgi:uncharacterized protein YbaR (Trm112 family)